jgi:hypothetical protein
MRGPDNAYYGFGFYLLPQARRPGRELLHGAAVVHSSHTLDSTAVSFVHVIHALDEAINEPRRGPRGDVGILSGSLGVLSETSGRRGPASVTTSGDADPESGATQSRWVQFRRLGRGSRVQFSRLLPIEAQPTPAEAVHRPGSSRNGRSTTLTRVTGSRGD